MNGHPERQRGTLVFAAVAIPVAQARTKFPRSAREDKRVLYGMTDVFYSG